MAFASYEHLRVLLEGPVLHVTLDRPARANALNTKLVEELRDLFVELYWRHDIRIVTLTGAGRHFCAGADIQELSGSPAEETGAALTEQRKISEIVLAMRRCPQPIVALVNGAASGGGFALALASDIRIATKEARFNAAFIRIGLSACDIGVSYFLPRMIGSSAAAEFLLTGRFIDAERARELGLVGAVVAADDLVAVGESYVTDMLGATPLGLRLTKEALRHAIDAGGLDAVVAMEDRNQILCAQSEDFAEGIAAFREKRPPRYGRHGSHQEG